MRDKASLYQEAAISSRTICPTSPLEIETLDLLYPSLNGIRSSSIMFVSTRNIQEPFDATAQLTEQDPHIFRLRLLILAPHGLEVQRRLSKTRKIAGREVFIDGFGGSKAIFARFGGNWDGDGIVVEVRCHSIPYRLVEAVIVAKVQVIAAETAIVLARY